MLWFGCVGVVVGLRCCSVVVMLCVVVTRISLLSLPTGPDPEGGRLPWVGHLVFQVDCGTNRALDFALSWEKRQWLEPTEQRV